MMIKNDLNYNDISTVEDYNSYLISLKQELILLFNLHYTTEEIRHFLKNKEIEDEISEIILNFLKKYENGKKRLYVDEKDKNRLAQFWYQQYVDFGKIENNLHYPNLIIFEFQNKEIKKLKNRLKKYINIETDKTLEEIIKRIKNNEFKSFKKVKEQYYLKFNINPTKKRNVFPKPEEHKFGDFIDLKIRGKRPIVDYVSSLRAIILGGEYDENKMKYFPFFMNNPFLIEKIKKYLYVKLNDVIKNYFPHLLDVNTNRILKSIPENFKNVRRLLRIPELNLTLFKEINWEKMDEHGFYDGVARYMKKGTTAYYLINFHPLSLFFSYIFREDFDIFIEQLMHHEFVHIMQYRYAEIYDKHLNNPVFKKKNPKKYKLFQMFASKQWIEEKIPNDPKFKGMSLWNYLHKVKGGHTKKFMEFMQKFKNCKKAMKSRGTIQTLYASFYYKLWGRDFGKGYWYLCDPNK